jgi:hypothetical protein
MTSTGGGGGDWTLRLAAVAIIVTALLSGPIGSAVSIYGSQPPWTDGQAYISHFRSIEQAPFWFGFLFVAAWIALFGRLTALAPESYRTRAIAMMAAATIYAAIISLNYTLQVAYVPLLVRMGDPTVAYLTMTNPASVGWALEMFGYGALGVACWLAAPLFGGEGARRRAIVMLMGANAVVNIGSAIATAVNVAWLMTPVGLAAYLFWNALVVATMAVIAVEFRRRA